MGSLFNENKKSWFVRALNSSENQVVCQKFGELQDKISPEYNMFWTIRTLIRYCTNVVSLIQRESATEGQPKYSFLFDSNQNPDNKQSTLRMFNIGLKTIEGDYIYCMVVNPIDNSPQKSVSSLFGFYTIKEINDYDSSCCDFDACIFCMARDILRRYVKNDSFIGDHISLNLYHDFHIRNDEDFSIEFGDHVLSSAFDNLPPKLLISIITDTLNTLGITEWHYKDDPCVVLVKELLSHHKSKVVKCIENKEDNNDYRERKNRSKDDTGNGIGDGDDADCMNDNKKEPYCDDIIIALKENFRRLFKKYEDYTKCLLKGKQILYPHYYLNGENIQLAFPLYFENAYNPSCVMILEKMDIYDSTIVKLKARTVLTLDEFLIDFRVLGGKDKLSTWFSSKRN